MDGTEGGGNPDYMGVQSLIAGLDPKVAAQQLYQQNPNIDPHILLPHLEAYSAAQKNAIMPGAEAAAGGAPVQTPGAPETDWSKVLTGAKSAFGGAAPTPAAPGVRPLSFGQHMSNKPVVQLPQSPGGALPPGLMNTGAPLGAPLQARRPYGY